MIEGDCSSYPGRDFGGRFSPLSQPAALSSQGVVITMIEMGLANQATITYTVNGEVGRVEFTEFRPNADAK